MAEELWLYILLIGLAGFLSLGLSLFSYYKLQDAPGGRQYMIAAFLSAVFSFAYIFELTSSTLEEVKFWLGAEYLVMPFIPGFLLWMCVRYAGIELRQRHLYLLFLPPIITVFTHHTNELHHLYYTSIRLRADTSFSTVELTYGPLFYVHALYLFLCLATSMVLLLLQLKKSPFRFRMQIVLMVLGLFVPIAANYFYVNKYSHTGIDLGPVSMSLSFILHGIALLSYQMFNVLPIAREKIFDSMREGVVVLDQRGAVLDYNQAMLKVVPEFNPLAVGKSIHKVLKNPRLAALICKGKECDYECSIEGSVEHYQVRFSPVFHKNKEVIGSIITFMNISERVILQDKLKKLASFDGLTKVYNRTYFLDKAESLLNSSVSGASLILFDIDHFKQVNDTYGHEAGDLVLSQVAREAKSHLRADDLLGRYGGEEFIILLPETTPEDAFLIANRLRISIAACLVKVDRSPVQVTSSFGISYIGASEAFSLDHLKLTIGKADQALYAAKRNGRNNIQVFLEEEDIVLNDSF
ncbi:histidine kinase N-terminal 7TM domain-containing diguanylate cyclase [Rossellomorea aquimaris]|uniref:Diguanylate cyclase n=1 Tax=Rossellomorea aquimaris TaxID=189382 RepID=A0A5D4TKV9_9BACI|nr:histidine kinase N-terminal 7TM domain-containing protein [Rossellomorea aquimaris]TYS75508.1 diguanylate cyclase [Rossellomorea aquimaris]